jgi:branched-chain amino acid transport system permease protein
MGITLTDIVPDDLQPQDVFYEISLTLGAAVLALSAWIKRSRFGYGLLAIREDEDTARMLGVPTERYKRIAFVVSAVLTGLLGIVYAHSLGYITTGSVYRDDTSLDMIVFCLLGGIGTLSGPVIGAFLLVFLNQFVLGDLLDFHLFVTGLLLVILILAAPDGLLGLAKRLRQ